MKEKQNVQIRKNNMKLYSIYKTLSWDTLFYATISFLFLTQVKKIEPADIVLLTSISAIFGIIFNIPSMVIINVFKRRTCIIIANILKFINILIVLLCNNFIQLIIATMINALGCSIKVVVDPSLLNASIPPSKYKGKIFAKINSKGSTGYYILNAITTIIAGILYAINPYIPIILLLIIDGIIILMSFGFEEPIEEVKKTNIKEQVNDIKEGFKFIFKSGRLKSLIVYNAIICALYTTLNNYEINLIKDYGISSAMIGFIFAILGLIRAYASRKQEDYHDKFKNKSLKIIGLVSTIQCIIIGIICLTIKNYIISILLIVLGISVRYIASGIYYNIIDKYLRNFTNKEIDVKIFLAKNICASLITAIIGLFASFLLKKTTIDIAMLIIGTIFIGIFIILNKYMKIRLGLKPEQYSNEERKYDEQ